MVRTKFIYEIKLGIINNRILDIEETQNNCIKKIYSTRGKVSTKVMLHMLKLPLMSERVSILQTQFLFRFLYLPEDALLYTLSRIPLWKSLLSTTEEPDTRSLKAAKRRFLQQNLEIRQRCRDSKLLSNCRRSISLDPILWLPMSKSERSRCIRWRLGWLPGGKPRPCPKHPTQLLSKKHAISCLDMHQRLFMPETIRDPLSFLLNILPLRPSLDQLHHNKLIPTKHLYGQKLFVWLKQFI
ncbi:hypothetical protein AB4K20DRAFT_1792719 [Rhizopus microsporus]|uniref:Uncharacterized protein n=1 Tax=Rhizopus microsporus TaxID=58291 RepID=A0A1X0SCP5_RHIZD|nr:hypothetical protein BCV71DRAFT_241313 [Rhizopus microsporus]